MNARSPRHVAPTIALTFLACVAACLLGGCGEVRGRRKVQEGNRLYREGQYKEAIAAFENAQQFVPELPQLWLNKGYTCRQVLVPGAKTDDNAAAAKCAKEAFLRYQQIAPKDPRGEQLYVQTLFDADDFETLAKMYEERFRKDPRNIEALNGLIQVFTKWNKLDETLQWYARKAELQSTDPEAQYGAGVYIYTQLLQKGGGPDKSTHDPRPDPNKPREVKTHPGFGPGDIVSQQRVDLAETAIKYLEKAIALRPKYHEAMTYANLLYRQKSYAYFEYPDDWQKSVDEAVRWAVRSYEARGMAVPENLKKAVAQGDLRKGEGGIGAGAATAKQAVKKVKGKRKASRRGKRARRS